VSRIPLNDAFRRLVEKTGLTQEAAFAVFYDQIRRSDGKLDLWCNGKRLERSNIRQFWRFELVDNAIVVSADVGVGGWRRVSDYYVFKLDADQVEALAAKLRPKPTPRPKRKPISSPPMAKRKPKRKPPARLTKPRPKPRGGRPKDYEWDRPIDIAKRLEAVGKKHITKETRVEAERHSVGFLLLWKSLSLAKPLRTLCRSCGSRCATVF
jgi:hypothetical protein